MKIIINSVMDNMSLCDGYGYRTVLFLQGCDLRCPGCQNASTWDINKGHEVDTEELASILRKRCFNKKLTISGGEPLLQKDALEDLLSKLSDFDVCLYTGHKLEEVPKSMLSFLKYIKVGEFIKDLRTTIMPFVGSSNQRFLKVSEINE